MGHLTVFATQDQSVSVVIPSKHLLDKSLQITAAGKQFDAWSAQDHADSYLFMLRIAGAWKKGKVTEQYLIYGKVDFSNPFNWEMVPYQKCLTCIGRAFQQLQVLWRTVFGGITVSQEQTRQYAWISKVAEAVEPADTSPISDDAFCKVETIERQWVLKGKKVNVLFNYAPIGFGGERLHFLIVPKKHRATFTDVTKEEYCESLALTKTLIQHFTKIRKNVENVYLLNKTGVDAGQTVRHWHLHLIFSMNKAQDFWGKLTVVRNILWGSSPMKKEPLAITVGNLRSELSTITS